MFDENSKELLPNKQENPGKLKVNKNKKNNFDKKAAVIAFAACVIVTAYCLIDTPAVGAASAISEYQSVKEEAADNTYEKFYQKAYDISEKNHHVSNRASITLGSLREEAKMEVLKISMVDYETPDNDENGVIEKILSSVSTLFKGNVISWLEVPGNGVFTVDLKSSEFIIDNERRYVLLRVPSPELTEFTIDYANVEILNFENSGIFKDSAKVGEDIAREQLQSAELKMRQKANSTQEYYLTAKKSTETILSNLVKQLNPQIEDLVVDVEFIE